MKHQYILALLIVSLVALPVVFAASPSYSVGDIGPAGGWVFYDCDADNETGNADGLTSDTCGWRYMEAAPADLASKYSWGDPGHFDMPEFIGFGKANTETLVFRSKTMTNNASKACLDYSVNGYDDWYLPSLNELKLMYQNLHNKGLGNFNRRTSYWSSTENGSDIDYAYGLGFANGTLYDDDRIPPLLVRPVRYFI